MADLERGREVPVFSVSLEERHQGVLGREKLVWGWRFYGGLQGEYALDLEDLVQLQTLITMAVYTARRSVSAPQSPGLPEPCGD